MVDAGGNLDEVAVGVPGTERLHRAERTAALHGSELELDSRVFHMLANLLGRRIGDETGHYSS